MTVAEALKRESGGTFDSPFLDGSDSETTRKVLNFPDFIFRALAKFGL